MTEPVPDRDLIAAHLAGDRGAFDEIVRRYERRVYAVCLRMCDSPDDARDAAQDTFVTALRALASFRGDAQLSTWLHRIAVNASLDVRRRASRQRAHGVDELPEVASTDPGPDDETIRSDRAAAVHGALRLLSDEHRSVVVLHDLQGLQYPEVAEALDVPVGTVKSRLHRARVELARHLGHLREAGTDPPGAASNISRTDR